MNFEQGFVMSYDGRLVSCASTFPVINPATEEVFASAPDAGRDELDAAVASAHKSLPAWRALPVDERAVMLKAFGQAIQAHAEDFMRLLTREQGKARQGAETELAATAAWIDEIAGLRLPPEVLEDDGKYRVETRFVPVGVVGAITPWNFPIVLAVWKFAPALVTGNTIVLKPSPYTPLCTLKLGELAQAIFPPGVFNVVSGGDELGRQIVEHPGINKIAFTGSTATGKKIMAGAAPTLKRITLELGGNDPAIVLPDVDPKVIAPQLFWAAFQNTAQFCIACKRLYVHADIYDSLLEELVAFARSVKLGDGADENVQLGPIQNKAQFEKLKELLKDARDNALNVVLGGEPLSGAGYFIPITIIDNPPESSRVVREEAFGPILPVLKYHSIDEAVARANSTEYGLAASIWSRNIEQAAAVAGKIEAGTVWINECQVCNPHYAFGGHKQSGIGVENSLHGLREYVNTQTITVNKANAV